MKIYKYVIPILDGEQEIQLIEGTQILSVQLQANSISERICMWAGVPDSGPVVVRSFQVVGTGEVVTGRHRFLGTVQQGPFVWHVFEKLYRGPR